MNRSLLILQMVFLPARIIDLPGDAGHVVTAVFIKESRLPREAREAVSAQIARAVHDCFTFMP